MFVHNPSRVVVLGGTFTASFMKFLLSRVIGSIKVPLKAFLHMAEDPRDLNNTEAELADVVRKEGMLGLEGRPDENLCSRLRHCACYGHDRNIDRVGNDAGQSVRSFRYWSSFGCGIVNHFIRLPDREFIRASHHRQIGYSK